MTPTEKAIAQLPSNAVKRQDLTDIHAVIYKETIPGHHAVSCGQHSVGLLLTDGREVRVNRGINNPLSDFPEDDVNGVFGLAARLEAHGFIPLGVREIDGWYTYFVPFAD